MRLRPLNRGSQVLAFLLGAVLIYATLELVPRISTEESDHERLSLLIPAVTSDTYRYSRNEGSMSVLTSQSGQRLEIPAAWLPGDVVVGEEIRVATAIDLADETVRFSTTLEPLEQTQ